MYPLVLASVSSKATVCLIDGLVAGDGSYCSQAKDKELAARGVYLLTTMRKHTRRVASQFQLAGLQLQHRVEELFAFPTNAFGAVRTTHWVSHALPPSLAGLFTGLFSLQVLDSLRAFTGNHVASRTPA